MASTSANHHGLRWCCLESFEVGGSVVKSFRIVATYQTKIKVAP